MSKKHLTSLAVASLLASAGLQAHAHHNDSHKQGFEAKPMKQGYQNTKCDPKKQKCTDAKCGAKPTKATKTAEGKCGEGKCGSK